MIFARPIKNDIRTEYKNHQLSYFNRILYIYSDMVDYDPVYLNNYIARYLKIRFRLDWVDYIIQSLTSYEVYNVLDKQKKSAPSGT